METNKHYVAGYTTTALHKKICHVLCALSMIIVVTSCNRFSTRTLSDKKHSIPLPQNHALVWYPQYIVSNDDYSRLLEKKNLRAKVRDIIRRGDVLRIIDIAGKSADDFIWYKVRFVRETTDDGTTKGWVLLRNAIRTHTPTKAQHISRKIIRREKRALRSRSKNH